MIDCLVEFINKYNWVITLFLQWFIAYHIFYLWKRINNNERLKHRDSIKQQLDEYIYWEVVKNKYHKIYLVNTNNFFTKYPDNSENIITEYSHIKAEIKSTRYDWVEFFESMPREVYRWENWKLYFKGTKKAIEKIKVYPIWIVPYENIDYIDFNWDEYNNSPLIFCKFNKYELFIRSFPKVFYKFPYYKIVYYIENVNYDEKNDPYDFRYMQLWEKIYK